MAIGAGDASRGDPRQNRPAISDAPNSFAEKAAPAIDRAGSGCRVGVVPATVWSNGALAQKHRNLSHRAWAGMDAPTDAYGIDAAAPTASSHPGFCNPVIQGPRPWRKMRVAMDVPRRALRKAPSALCKGTCCFVVQLAVECSMSRLAKLTSERRGARLARNMRCSGGDPISRRCGGHLSRSDLPMRNL